MTDAAATPSTSGTSLLLEALVYPARASFDPSDRASVIKLVTWIEDRKIRELDIDERVPLRAPDTFDAAFAEYLQTVECPHAWVAADVNAPANAKVLAWLLVQAVAYEYEERKPQIEAAAKKAKAKAKAPPPSPPAAESAAGIASLPTDCHAPFTSICTKLGLDPATTSVRDALDAAAKEGRAREGRNTGGGDGGESSDGGGKGGGSGGGGKGGGGGDGRSGRGGGSGEGGRADGEADATARGLSYTEALRILHIESLRKLQDDANEITVLAQEFTCAPKINSALGKVGR